MDRKTSKNNGLRIIKKYMKDKRFSFFADPQKNKEKECHHTFGTLPFARHTSQRFVKAKESNLATAKNNCNQVNINHLNIMFMNMKIMSTFFSLVMLMNINNLNFTKMKKMYSYLSLTLITLVALITACSVQKITRTEKTYEEVHKKDAEPYTVSYDLPIISPTNGSKQTQTKDGVTITCEIDD